MQDLSDENMSDEEKGKKKLKNGTLYNNDEEFKEKIDKLPHLLCKFCNEDI